MHAVGLSIAVAMVFPRSSRMEHPYAVLIALKRQGFGPGVRLLALPPLQMFERCAGCVRELDWVQLQVCAAVAPISPCASGECFFLIRRSHSISFTRAQGIPK